MDRNFLFAIAKDENPEGPIPKADILAGIRSDDTELAGAIYDIVTTDKLRRRIEPPLPDEELDNLITEYFERCILTDPKGEWTLTRYSAAWEVQGCMLNLWDSDGGRRAGPPLMAAVTKTESPHAFVRGAHPSRTAKGGAAGVCFRSQKSKMGQPPRQYILQRIIQMQDYRDKRHPYENR